MTLKPGTTIRLAQILQPKQTELSELIENGRATNIFFGGPKGGTKSHSIRWIALDLASRYDGLRVAIWRRTTQDLKDNHITKLLNEEAPDLRQIYNQQDMQINLPNGSIIAFRYAETENDLRQKQGGDWDIVAVDEGSQWSEVEIRECFMPFARRSQANEKIKYFSPKFLIGFNWGGISHSYNKRICMDKEFQDNEDPADYAFVEMYGWDNAYWSMDALKEDGFTMEDYESWSDARRQEYFISRSKYGRKLFQLPETARKQLLYGDPDVFEGMFFSMFSRKKNVEVTEKWQRLPDFNLLGGLDYGSETAVEVLANDYENRCTFFAECYTEKSGAALRAYDIAEFLIENKLWNLRILCDTNMGFDPDDPDDFNKAPITVFRKIIAAKFKAEHHEGKEPHLEIVQKKSPNKHSYRVFCNEAFKNGLIMSELKKDAELIETLKQEDFPIAELRITPDCNHLIESITSLVHKKGDKNGLDFDDKTGKDHAYDAAKMAFTNIRKAQVPFFDVRPQWFRELMEADPNRGWQVGMG